MAEQNLKKLEFFTPFPITANHAWLVNGARRFRTKQYLEFEKAVKEIVDGRTMQPGTYRIKIYLFPDNQRRFDADNRVKTLLDAITGAQLWEDDSLVNEIHVYKGLPATVACAKVVVTRERTIDKRVNPHEFGLQCKHFKRPKDKK